MVQATPIIEKIKSTLIRRLSTELGNLADEKPDTYRTFWQEFGSFLKEGLATDPDSKSKFVDLLRFQSSHSQDATDLVSLADYVGRMQPEQSEIYYILGDDYEVVSRSSHLEYFKMHELEVLYLTDPLDSFMLIGLTEYRDKPLKNVDDANLDLPEADKSEEEAEAEKAISGEEFETLLSRFKDVLGERVEDVRESKILTDSPCRLVNPAEAGQVNMDRVQRLLGREHQMTKRILEINRKNPLIQDLSARLAADGDDPLLEPLMEQLFENELVSEGLHPNPAGMVPRIQQLMAAAARTRAKEVEE
jgi:molecular chaperone HtpG